MLECIFMLAARSITILCAHWLLPGRAVVRVMLETPFSPSTVYIVRLQATGRAVPSTRTASCVLIHSPCWLCVCSPSLQGKGKGKKKADKMPKRVLRRDGAEEVEFEADEE